MIRYEIKALIERLFSFWILQYLAKLTP